MERLLIAGFTYLIVIAIILTIKPAIMFTENGTWKEFGIGRNPATHTWMPFWLFAVLWALISYILTTILFALLKKPIVPLTTDINTGSKSTNQVNIINTSDLEENTIDTIINSIAKTTKKARSKGKPMELPDGYYMLNTDATESAGGIPKYVYLGKGLPEYS